MGRTKRASWPIAAGILLAGLAATIYWVPDDTPLGIAGEMPGPTQKVRATPIVSVGLPKEEKVDPTKRRLLFPDTRLDLGQKARSLRLVIKEESNSQPVPGAEVWFLDLDQVTADRVRQDVLELDNKAEGIVHEFGKAYTADSRGIAFLPWPRREGVIIARSGELFGRLLVKGEAGKDQLLKLHRQDRITLEVVDGQGKPLAGVPVICRYLHYLTGVDGRIYLDHPKQSMSRRKKLILKSPVTPPDEMVILPIDQETMRARWVVPGHGRLIVHVKSGAEQVAVGNLEVGVKPTTKAKVAKMKHISVPHYYTPENARVVFPYVGLSEFLVIKVRDRGGSGEVTRRVPGFRKPGEKRTFTMVFSPTYPVLYGRLLDERGKPLCRQRVVVNVEGTDCAPDSDDMVSSPRGVLQKKSQPFRQNLTTDSQGFLEIFLHSSSFLQKPKNGQWRLLISIPRDGPGQAGVARSFKRAITNALLRGRNHLGDMILAGGDLLIAGIVVDQGGLPLPRVPINLEFLFFPRQGGKGKWVPFPGRPVITDLSGRFSVNAPLPIDSLRVRVEKEGFIQTDWVTCRSGATNLRLVLVPRGKK